MTHNDCFELGIQTLKAKKYYYSSQWLNESLSRLPINESSTDLKLSVLNNLRTAYIREG